MKKLLHTIWYYLNIDNIELTNQMKIVLHAYFINATSTGIYKICAKRKHEIVYLTIHTTNPKGVRGVANNAAKKLVNHLEEETGELIKLTIAETKPYKLYIP